MTLVGQMKAQEPQPMHSSSSMNTALAKFASLSQTQILVLLPPIK